MRTLREELRSHLDFAVEENLNRGMSREEARTAAMRAFGGMTQTKEHLRSQRGLPFLEVLAQDVRYGLRQLRKSPGFTMTAVITLALGIGANTAIFTLVHGVLERSLPVADPSRLYRVGDQDTCCYFDGFESDNGDFDLFPYDLYLQLQQSSPEFEQLAAVQAGGSGLSCAQRIVSGQADALGVCIRQLLCHARRRRLCGPPAHPERRQARSRAGSRPQLPDLADGLRR